MKRIVTLAVALALMVPGTAFAQSSSTCQAYSPQTCISVTTHQTTSGTLPFTGLDVALLALGGGTLLGAGFVVRRVSRRLN
jgi:hypothetical protein